MEMEVLEKTLETVFSSNELADEVLLVWHAGEPLTAGLEFYQKATQLIERSAPAGVRIIQTFQTNGVLINDDWCEFIKDNKIQIGVSIDGPKHIHDRNRLGWTGKGSFDITMRGIQFLQKHKIDFIALMVITKESLEYADEIVNFFLDNNISSVGFNIEELIAGNTATSLNGGLSVEQQYKIFIRRFIDLWYQNSDRLKIREFQRLSAYISEKSRNPHFVAPQIESSKRGILTITRTGDIIPISPDLAFGTTNDEMEFVIGNINEQVELKSHFETQKFKNFSMISQQARKNVEKNASTLICVEEDTPAPSFLNTSPLIHLKHSSVDISSKLSLMSCSISFKKLEGSM
jgi:uncharacterized protein